jgi:peptidoglycan/LPS O-acetylase OafA/YrhL
MRRIKELDYLRGLAALGIVFYHYTKWLYIYGGAETFIGKVSVYGVEIFYILSGITLFHVYEQSLDLKKEALIPYFSKRFFRIFPLFWLSIMLTLLIGLKQIPILKLLLNVSGLFSIVAWDQYIAPGTWSIGNELVFYLLFPFLMTMLKRKPIYFAFTGLFFAFVFNYFAYFIFNPNDSLHNQWSSFVNPLNHLFLFYIGLCIPFILKRHHKSNTTGLLLAFVGSVLLFAFPSGYDGIHLLYGSNRWIFSIGSILIGAGFYQMDMKLPEILHSPLKHLGEISYGIYLLHPFVYQLICIGIRNLNQVGWQIPPSNTILIAIAVCFTILLSHFIYYYFERYFIKKGAMGFSNFYKS